MATVIQETPTPSGALNGALPEYLEAFIPEGQAGDFLGFSKRTMQDKRAKGNGPKFYVIGRSIRYRRRDLREYAESRVRRSTSET